MLIRYSVENFLSFNERQIFSLIPGRGTLKAQHKSSPVNGLTVLKTAVIYGANASGKSNLIKAIEFGKNLILKGTKAEQPISFESFKLDKNAANADSRFEYEIQHKNKNYAYGFVFNSTEIKEEWLFEITKTSETKIFERETVKGFDLSYFKKLNKKEENQFIEFTAKSTPRNQLFLTQIRNSNITEHVSNIEDLLNIIDWFQNALTVIYPSSKNKENSFKLFENTDLQNLFTEMLDYFDTGINGIDLKEISFDKIDVPEDLKEDIKAELLSKKSEKTSAFLSNPQDDKYYIILKKQPDKLAAKILKTKHEITGGGHELFDLRDESDGTRRIMDLIPLMIDLFKGNNVFIVDELERSLHPNLVYDLMDFFLDKCEGINSQFIVASHESILLTQKLLRKDEIWFIVKDKKGGSHLHSLEDYNIRFDKELRRDYLLGRYKGVPKLGNRNNLTILP